MYIVDKLFKRIFLQCLIFSLFFRNTFIKVPYCIFVGLQVLIPRIFAKLINIVVRDHIEPLIYFMSFSVKQCYLIGSNLQLLIERIFTIG